MGGSGALTTYLGTAPGVGKTYAMLRAGRLRSVAGQRVVVGWVERHGRAETRAQVGDLEVVPPRPVAYGSGTFAEFDVEAVMASGPASPWSTSWPTPWSARPGAGGRRWRTSWRPGLTS